MVTVPVVSQPSVSPGRESERLTTFRATPEQFGSLQARAEERDLARLSQGLESVANIFDQFQERQDNTDFNEAKVAYDNAVNQIMYGDGTEDNPGVLNLKAGKAIEQGGLAREQLNQITSDIVGRYNPAVQRRLTIATSASNARHQANLARHMAVQRDVYDQQLSDARKQTAAEDAARAYSDTKSVSEQISAAKLMVVGDAKRNGYSPDVQKHETQNAVDNVVRAAFQSAIKQQDTPAAEQLLEKFGGQVSGPINAEMVNMLRTSTRLREAQQETDRIISTAGLSPSQRLAEARKIKNPEVRSLVEKSIAIRNREEAQAQSQAVLLARTNASRFIVAGGQLAEWGQANPEMFQTLAGDPDEFAKLRRLQENMAAGRVFAISSDGKTAMKYITMNQEQLAEVTDDQLEGDKASMTESEWNRVIGAIGGAREKARGTEHGKAAFTRGEALLKQYSPSGFGFRVKTPNEGQVQAMNTVRNELAKWIATYTERGKVPTDSEIRKEVQRLYTPFTEPSTWFLNLDEKLGRLDTYYGSEIRAMTPEQREGFTVDLKKVSGQAKAELTSRFQQHLDRKPTEDEMREFFKAEAIGDKKTQRRMLGIDNRNVPETPEPAAAASSEATPVATPASLEIPKITAPAAKKAESKDFFEGLADVEAGAHGSESLAGGTRIKGAEDMTIAEVARRAGTKAAGLFQIQRLVPRAKKAGLNPDKDKFTPENQKKIAKYLIKQRGVTKKMIKENLDEAVNRLAREWAAIPVVTDQKGHKQKVKAGESFYKGVGNNKALMTVEEARELVKSLGG